MLRLDDLIGHKVHLAIIDSEQPAYTVTLHGVETGGLWVEGDELAELTSFLVPKKSKGQPQQKPVFFLPYGRIHFLIALSTELDETTS